MWFHSRLTAHAGHTTFFKGKTGTLFWKLKNGGNQQTSSVDNSASECLIFYFVKAQGEWQWKGEPLRRNLWPQSSRYSNHLAKRYHNTSLVLSSQDSCFQIKCFDCLLLAFLGNGGVWQTGIISSSVDVDWCTDSQQIGFQFSWHNFSAFSKI